MKTIKWILIAMLALVSLVGVFATEESAAVAQSTQLGLHMDKAIQIGANVIANVSANGSVNNSNVTQLQTILDSLIDLRANVTTNLTLDEVKEARDQAKDLVKEFRDAAKDLFSAEFKAKLKLKVEKEFNETHAMQIKKAHELRIRANEDRFDSFVEKHQKDALNLSDDENVTAFPGLERKFDSIKKKIRADEVSNDDIAAIRTQIKAEIEGLKADRVNVTAQIRANILTHRIEVLGMMINQTNDTNLSLALLDLRQNWSGLLDDYVDGRINATVFSKAVVQTQSELADVLQDYPRAFSRLRSYMAPGRIEVRAENKQDLMEWRSEQRDDRMRERFKLQLGNGSFVEIKQEYKDGRLRYEEKLKVDDQDDDLDETDDDSDDNSGSDDDSDDNSGSDDDSDDDDDNSGSDDDEEDDSDDDDVISVQVN
ncbi:MAG TPA: hypothetical protein VK158_03080 [Acidobacteriota bacterium]|nr:hypothetical protein [Acidobacteriota bacterium]